MHPLRGTAAIVGLGITDQGKVFHTNHVGFAVKAVQRALVDAGLERDDVDGLLLNPGLSWGEASMGAFQLQQALGLRNLNLAATMNLGGASAGAMVAHAAEAIASGRSSVVVCVFSDAPLKPPRPEKDPSRGASTGSGATYAFARGFEAAYGYFGIAAQYAMIARRYMHVYGLQQDHLGAVAVAQRQWANRNPLAQYYDRPLTLEEYHASRWIVEPFHLYDCCLVSNGGLALVVTSAERARDLRQPPVYILGVGQGHPGGDPVETLTTGAPIAKQQALTMANLTLDDIDVVELYDCYTFTVVISLEDYGFVGKGEGGPFIAAGNTAPGGCLPVNTGGGQLSAFYMWGMTPLSEAVIQLRGQGGARQVPGARTALASGNGGVLSTHSTTILGREV